MRGGDLFVLVCSILVTSSFALILSSIRFASLRIFHASPCILCPLLFHYFLMHYCSHFISNVCPTCACYFYLTILCASFHSSSITHSVGPFGRVASAASLHDAHLGQAGVLALSEEALNASIEASMHTPKPGGDSGQELEDLVPSHIIAGKHSTRIAAIAQLSISILFMITLCC